MKNGRYRTMKFSVMMVLLFGVMIVSGCADQYKGLSAEPGEINYPVGLALHPDGRFLYVVNSNFDMKYREEDGGTVSVIDTETLEILPGVSPFIPSFGGYIKVNQAGTRAYVTTRQANELVVLDVAADGGGLLCKSADGTTRLEPTDCRLSRVPNRPGGAVLSVDPFGLDVATITRTDGSGQQTSFDLVSISHLRGSQVTTVGLQEGGALRDASMRSASLVDGGNQIVTRPGTLDFYVAGRSTNQVVYFQPYVNAGGQVEAIVRRGAVNLNNLIASVDTRGLAFNRGGDRLYAVTRRPNLLHVVGIEPGTLRHEVISSVSLSGRPSDVVVHEGVDGRELVYATSYDDGAIEVIDPVAGVLLETIEVGQSPYQFVIDRSAERCRFAGDTCRGYVSLFHDSGKAGKSCEEDDGGGCGAVAVIDLDPASPTYHQVITKIR